MNDRFLVSVLHSLANLNEQLQALALAQLVLVAVAGDGYSGDVLHHEVRAAFRSGAGVEDFGDCGVVHQRQGLPFGFEARHHFARVHTRFNQLEGHAAANRLLLLGQPDFAHSAFADPLQQIGKDR